jgi:cytochrome c-type biogenesis protein CcmH/NrfG
MMAFIHSRYDFKMIRKGTCSLLSLTLLFLVARCYCQAVSGDAQAKADAHLREAHRLLSENKPDAAIPEFRAVTTLDPSNIDALGNLGVLLFFQENYSDAIPQLRDALRLYGRSRRFLAWANDVPAILWLPAQTWKSRFRS